MTGYCRIAVWTTIIISLAVVAGCKCPNCGGLYSDARPKSAIAILQPTEGSNTRGTVRFLQQGDTVRITAIVEGLKPKSKHGIHIHEFGDFSRPDAKSAGGHYNPDGFKHGGPEDKERHAGDLGNLIANSEGVATFELTVSNLSVAGLKNPILGRGVVVHAGPDDLKSQPTGNAGSRIAFGVIGVAKSD